MDENQTDIEKAARRVVEIMDEREKAKVQTPPQNSNTTIVVVGLAVMLMVTLIGAIFVFSNSRTEIQGLEQDNMALRSQMSELAQRNNADSQRLLDMQKESNTYLSKIAELETQLASMGNQQQEQYQTLKGTIDEYTRKNEALQKEIAALNAKVTPAPTTPPVPTVNPYVYPYHFYGHYYYYGYPYPYNCYYYKNPCPHYPCTYIPPCP